MHNWEDDLIPSIIQVDDSTIDIQIEILSAEAFLVWMDTESDVRGYMISEKDDSVYQAE